MYELGRSEVNKMWDEVTRTGRVIDEQKQWKITTYNKNKHVGFHAKEK